MAGMVESGQGQGHTHGPLVHLWVVVVMYVRHLTNSFIIILLSNAYELTISHHEAIILVANVSWLRLLQFSLAYIS